MQTLRACRTIYCLIRHSFIYTLILGNNVFLDLISKEFGRYPHRWEIHLKKNKSTRIKQPVLDSISSLRLSQGSQKFPWPMTSSLCKHKVKYCLLPLISVPWKRKIPLPSTRCMWLVSSIHQWLLTNTSKQITLIPTSLIFFWCNLLLCSSPVILLPQPVDSSNFCSFYKLQLCKKSTPNWLLYWADYCCLSRVC